MKKSCLIFLTALICLTGCTTVPVVRKPAMIKNDVYTVRIKGDYGANKKAVKYAINQFVKSTGHESYDAELTQKPGFMRQYYLYTVTVPGSVPVEDMSKVKVLDQNAMDGWVVILTYGVGIPFIVLTSWAILAWLLGGGH